MNEPMDNPSEGMAEGEDTMLDFDLGQEEGPGAQLQTEEEKTGGEAASKPAPIKPTATQQKPVPTGEAGQQPPQQAEPQAPAPLTPETIKSLVSEVFQAAQPKPAAEQPKQITQEEFDKTFGVVKMTPEMYEQLTGIPVSNPNQITAFNNLLQGVVQQAVRMSNHLIQEAFSKAEGRITPIEEFRNQVIEVQMENRFFKAYPDLKPYRDLLVELRGSMEKEGMKFQTEKEAFKFVADKAKGMLAKLNIPTTSGATAPAKQPGQRKMTPTSVGGQTSGGTNGSATPTKADEIADLFA